jgi:GR25 family glycosyltransferase involved in LPS biosynthesis
LNSQPPNTADEQSFWDQIDAILVINLKHRKDRWEKITSELKVFGVDEKAVRIEAIDGKELLGYSQKPWFTKRTPENVAKMKAGSAGCCLSHRKAIEFAKAQGYKRILLMEDDARFKKEFNDAAEDFLSQFLRNINQCDMLYLGFYQKTCVHVPTQKTDQDGLDYQIWRIRGPLMLHATIIDQRVYDKLLAGLPTTNNIWSWMTYWGSIDSWIQNKLGRQADVHIYGCRPNLVVQHANYSDICGRMLTVEESEGIHRESELIPVSEDQFSRSIQRPLLRIIQQTLKRTSRVVRSYSFGYSKT